MILSKKASAFFIENLISDSDKKSKLSTSNSNSNSNINTDQSSISTESSSSNVAYSPALKNNNAHTGTNRLNELLLLGDQYSLCSRTSSTSSLSSYSSFSAANDLNNGVGSAPLQATTCNDQSGKNKKFFRFYFFKFFFILFSLSLN